MKKSTISSLIREMILETLSTKSIFPRIRILEFEDEVFFLLEPENETEIPNLDVEDPEIPYLRLYRSITGRWNIGHVDNSGYEGQGYGIQLYLAALDYVFPEGIVSAGRSYLADIAHQKLRNLGVSIEIDANRDIRVLSGGPGTSMPVVKEKHT